MLYIIFCHCLLCCSMALALAFGSSFCWRLWHFDIANYCALFMCFIFFCFVLLSTSLFSYLRTSWFRLILCILCLTPSVSHFSDKPSFFHCRTLWETEIWVLDVLIATALSLFFALFTDRSREYQCAPVKSY